MNKFLIGVVSILFPPLGVALTKGWSAQLGVNIVLTICGYLPGIAHAIYHCVTTPTTP